MSRERQQDKKSKTRKATVKAKKTNPTPTTILPGRTEIRHYKTRQDQTRPDKTRPDKTTERQQDKKTRQMPEKTNEKKRQGQYKHQRQLGSDLSAKDRETGMTKDKTKKTKNKKNRQKTKGKRQIRRTQGKYNGQK